MNTELKIEKSAAVLAHENAPKKVKKALEDLLGKQHFIKDVTERIKTFEDVLEANGVTELDRNRKFDFYKYEGDLHLYYQWIAEQIAKALNEGWTPDWNDTSEYKYFPWFKMGSPGFRYDVFGNWYSGSLVGSRLCFKNSKLAKYAGEQFTDVYEQFMLIK